MKTKLLTLLIIIAFNNSCTKGEKNDDSRTFYIEKNYFISKTQQLYGHTVNGQNGSVSKLDYNSTELLESVTDNKTYHFYYTKSVNSQGDENGGLISLILPGKKVFHCFVESINNLDGSFTNYYSDFSDTDFGTVSVSKGIIISSNLGIPETTITSKTVPRRTWWGCTTDCIGDAHIACFQDTKCQVLLLGSNLAGKGAGSASISVACGATCLANKEMDLLPQY